VRKKEVGLEVNAEKTKYVLLSRHQNAGQDRDIKISNRAFENMAQFKYLGTTVTNQILVQGEIKRRLNSGNASYHSVQKLKCIAFVPSLMQTDQPVQKSAMHCT
jgi:hypothetical protein